MNCGNVWTFYSLTKGEIVISKNVPYSQESKESSYGSDEKITINVLPRGVYRD